MSKLKMNTLLAKVEHEQSSANAMVRDYAAFFKTKQGAFKGEKNTYVAREGFLDKPEKRGLTRVTTTVAEKFEWFEDKYIPYLIDLFKVEATNSKGANRVELKVNGHSFGFLTAAELMRLRNIITNKELDSMYQNIPVRSDAKVYEPCTDEEYEGREVMQTPISKSVERTTEMEEVILKDPNIDPQHLPANYRAAVSEVRTTLEIGNSTHQDFTGEWTQRKRAELLRRKSAILSAITAALKEVNDVEVESEHFNAEAFMKYLHYGE
jgi:hypothetical protein